MHLLARPVGLQVSYAEPTTPEDLVSYRQSENPDQVPTEAVHAAIVALAKAPVYERYGLAGATLPVKLTYCSNDGRLS